MGEINKILKTKESEVCKGSPSWVRYVATHSELNCPDASILYRYLGEPSPLITEDIVDLANKGYTWKEIVKILYSSSYLGFIEGSRNDNNKREI